MSKKGPGKVGECKDTRAKQLETLKKGGDLGEEWGGMTREAAGNKQFVVSSHASSSGGFHLPRRPISFLLREGMDIFGICSLEL